MEAKQTSLVDLLERIPQGARLVVEHDQFSSSSHPVGRLCHEAAAALRAALAQQAEPVQDQRCRAEPRSDGDFVCDCKIGACPGRSAEPVQEPVAWMCSNPELMAKGYERFSSRCEGDWNIPVYLSPPQRKPQAFDEAMSLPRAMAQAYESGYKAGVANEREACAKVCESRFMGDMTREDMEARRCAAAIRARGIA